MFQLSPEYYVLKINNFNNVAHDSLDEWVYYLKNNEVPGNAQAKGLKEVRELLRIQSLNPTEQRAYYRDMENTRLTLSLFETARIEGRDEGRKEGRKEGIEEGKRETARNLKKLGVLTARQIADATGLTEDEVSRL